ncbi:hypothetical protein CCACVL1_28994 [Corchorus capsularis]|uniref:Uncharacterized protein n=1 Tax=Corchorus capsularis TaxID=210143 RepID=A0A1R3G4C9_COCAP|nr:hypothetical protein CCACVL1_28994 [Corchorus capsularis]
MSAFNGVGPKKRCYTNWALTNNGVCCKRR